MNSSSHKVFETSKGKFRLTKNFIFSSQQEDGSYKSNCWIKKSTDKNGNPYETGNFNPSVFLAFTYLDEDYTKQSQTSIWTSDKHIYQIKKVFGEVAEDLMDNESFVLLNNTDLTVTPGKDEAKIITKQNGDWIGLRLFVTRDDAGMNQEPAVAIETSKSNGYSSILTIDEFLSLNDMLQGINYSTLNHEATVEYLSTLKQSSYQGYQKAPSSSVNVQKNTVKPYTKPAFQTSKYKSMPKQDQLKEYDVEQSANELSEEDNPFPAPSAKVETKPTFAKLPPRPAAKVGKPMIDKTLLDEAEVEDLDINDSAAVADIFSKGE